MDKYLKAFFLTLFLLFLGLIVTRYLDDQRMNAVSSQIEESSIDAQSSGQLLLYESIFGDKENTCPAIISSIDLQSEKARKVLSRLEAVKSENFLADYGLLKRRYLNQSIDLYLLMEKYARECGNPGIKPLVFFYPDKENCPDCIAQGKILDSVRDECGNIRVFAFPRDLGLPIVEILEAKYAVGAVPSIIFSDNKLEGLSSKEKVKELIACK